MSTQPPSEAQIDGAKLRNYLIGGVAAGGSAGLLTSLVNHLQTLNKKRERAEDTSGDDDVLYVNLHHRPGAMPKAAGTVLGLSGGALGAVGSFALVNRIYEKLKRQQLQKELDAAQQTYLDSMAPGEERRSEVGGQKSAGAKAPDSMWDVALASPAVLAILTGVGSGVLTNKILDKNFPAPRPPAGLRPRRLVVRDQPEEGEETPKAASAVDDDAWEHLLRTVLAMPQSAQASGLGDLAKAASAGRTSEILLASDEGPEAMFEFTKGASAPESQARRDLAAGWLVREPEIAPVVKLAAALEFWESCPLMCALARAADVELQDDLVKLAALTCQAARASGYDGILQPEEAGLEKQALDLVDTLRSALEKPMANDPETNLNSLPSEDSAEGAPTKVVARGTKARALVNANRDAIDDILAPGKPAAPVAA